MPGLPFPAYLNKAHHVLVRYIYRLTYVGRIILTGIGRTVMKLHHHTAFSAVIAGILFMLFRSWGLAAASFITGIFIDLDHIADVVREHGWSTKISEFFEICHNAKFDRIILFCHGWEWLVLWSAAAWLTGWNPWVTGALIGLTHHIIIDTITNSRNFLSYSLIWRWKKNFHFDTVFPKMTVYKYNDLSSAEIKKQQHLAPGPGCSK